MNDQPSDAEQLIDCPGKASILNRKCSAWFHYLCSGTLTVAIDRCDCGHTDCAKEHDKFIVRVTGNGRVALNRSDAKKAANWLNELLEAHP